MKLFKHWFGPRSLLLLCLLVLTGTTSNCTTSSILKGMLGGGPNVATDIQVGKTNTQTIGVTNNTSPSVSVRPKARIDNVDQRTITTYQLPTWVWIFIIITYILGWATDTPRVVLKRLLRRGKEYNG